MLARHRDPIADFSLGQPSLDEVFLALTGRPAEQAAAEDGGGYGAEEESPRERHSADLDRSAPLADELAPCRASRSTRRPRARAPVRVP